MYGKMSTNDARRLYALNADPRLARARDLMLSVSVQRAAPWWRIPVAAVVCLLGIVAYTIAAILHPIQSVREIKALGG